MVKVKVDMTGWNMWEHGISDSRLTIIKQDEDYISPDGKHYARWLCECNCEEHNIISVIGSHLKSGAIKSCGCLGNERRIKANTKHGNSNTRLYKIWQNIKNRCYNPDSEFYYCYGGKGVKMCDEWREHFEMFYDWAILNGYKEDALFAECTIDRIDINGDYCPENCRWTDKFTQAMNHGLQKNNKSGVRGVKWDSSQKKWYAQINIKNNRIFLGRFDNKNDAIVARLKAELKHLGSSAPQCHLFQQYKINESVVI